MIRETGWVWFLAGPAAGCEPGPLCKECFLGEQAGQGWIERQRFHCRAGGCGSLAASETAFRRGKCGRILVFSLPAERKNDKRISARPWQPDYLTSPVLSLEGKIFSPKKLSSILAGRFSTRFHSIDRGTLEMMNKKMKFTAWYLILVGVLMLAQWGFFLAVGAVPESKTEPVALAFHLVAEFATAVGLCVSGIFLLRRKPRAKNLALFAAGMLAYTTIVSPGYFAQLKQWPLVIMFAILLSLDLAAAWFLLHQPV